MCFFKSKISALFFLFGVALTSFAQPAQPFSEEISGLSVKYGGVHVKGNKDIEWSYPYFVGAKNSRVEKLNAWLRTESIVALFPLDDGDDMTRKASLANDAALIGWLKNDTNVQTASAELARVDALKVFGTLFFFSTDRAWRDSRYYLDLESRVFDYAIGGEVKMESLFKPDSEELFDKLLAKEIKRVLTASKRADRNCVKRRGDNCIGSEIDVDACIQNTKFEWRYLQIIDNRHMSVQYPYRQNVHQACGTEFGFDLKGRELEQALVNPELFKHGRILAGSEKLQR